MPRPRFAESSQAKKIINQLLDGFLRILCPSGFERAHLIEGWRKASQIEAQAAMEVEGLEVVADRGYFKNTEIQRCAESSISVIVPRPQTSHNKAKGLFGTFPFGTDFTDEEVMLGKALKRLKKKAESKLEIIKLLLQPLACDTEALQPYLTRMQLESPSGLEEKLYARLLRAELSQVIATTAK